MCYFSRLFVIQLKIKIPQTNNCNFDFYVTLNFTEYILWIKHKPQIKYQYILLVDSTFYCILFFDSSDCRNNTVKHQFICHLPVNICSVVQLISLYHMTTKYQAKLATKVLQLCYSVVVYRAIGRSENPGVPVVMWWA